MVMFFALSELDVDLRRKSTKFTAPRTVAELNAELASVRDEKVAPCWMRLLAAPYAP